MSSIYPTRQPVTTANIQAFLADVVARKKGTVLARPTAVIGKVTMKAALKTLIVERMAEQMRDHGEGMTRHDLRRKGWSYPIIDICADEANALASERAN